VPFLSRRITGFSPRYPSIIRVPGKDEVIAALHKEDREEEIKEATKILRRQEMERLLYVAVTRARHTLVLAHDRALFSPVHDRLAAESQLKFLRGDKNETSCVVLDGLTATAEPCDETLRAAVETADSSATPAFSFTPLDSAALDRARMRASEFVRKQNPSDYEEPPELAAESAPSRTTRILSGFDNPATLYGSWWHTLFQHFPWTGGPAQWQAAFGALQSTSPDPSPFPSARVETFRKGTADFAGREVSCRPGNRHAYGVPVSLAHE
jgi:ATP-dependent exoDNAse (exonuclease V) beta subunit